MSILIVLACSAIAALIATMITLTIVYKDDTGLQDRIFDLEHDLQFSKERINEDLVGHNRRLTYTEQQTRGIIEDFYPSYD